MSKIEENGMLMVNENGELSGMLSGADVFKLRDTHGLPLSVIIEKLYEMGSMVDWLGFILAAAGAGWKGEKTKREIYSALSEAGICKEFKEKVKERFSLLESKGFKLWQ